MFRTAPTLIASYFIRKTIHRGGLFSSCAIVLPLLLLVLQKKAMTTYYCISIEEALKRAREAGKQKDCYFGGITLPSGKRGFAVYRDGKVIERYSYISDQQFFGR